MNTNRLKSAFINALGTIGYLFCILQWLWATMIFLPIILKSDFVKSFIDTPVKPDPIINQPSEISTAGLVIAILIAIIMIALTIYVLVKIPSSVGKTGGKITHKATAATLPLITHHKKITEKKRLQLTARLQFIFKLILCLIPFGLIFLPIDDEAISRDIVIIIGASTALCSIGIFSLQVVMARLLRIDYRQSW